MSHDAREKSQEDGEPIELYQFAYQGQFLRYTSAQDPHTVAGSVWTPAKLEHGDIEHSSELAKMDLEITCNREFAIAAAFRGPPPSARIALTVWEWHIGETDAERKIIWAGSILNCEATPDGNAKLTGENILTSLRRQGLRRKQQRPCQHSLYEGTPGRGCALDRTAFARPAIITSLSGLALTSPTFDLEVDGWFAGGFVEVDIGGGFKDRRAIRSHTGDTILISHPFATLEAGGAVVAYAGCDHTPTQCDDKFDNYVNYGGFPDRQKQNPIGTSSPF